MQNLSADLEIAISNAIEVMGFDVDVDKVASEKLSALMQSKIKGFNHCKGLILDWQNSQNAPSSGKLRNYIKNLIEAGNNSVETLRQALRKKIDVDEVDAEKLGVSIEAKQIVYKAIYEINSGVIQLQAQLDADNIDLKSREFKIGYPERFANQEFFPEKNYYKEWYDEKTDAIILDPKGTVGEIIVLDNLRMALPQLPKNKKTILFHRYEKKEQYWRRPVPPVTLTPDTENEYAEFIMEEFRRRREGVWFYNDGKPIWLTPAHYMGLTHNKMLDTGGYKEFRWAQCQMYYFTLACTVDPRSVGELFVKGRRTGFTEEIIDHFVNDSTSMKNALFGMTSKIGIDAEAVFLKYSYGIQNLPFYFIPVVKNKIDDKNKMEFGKVSENTKEAKKKRETSTSDYLNTKVDWMNTTILSYDSKKLTRYLADEAGKLEKPNNIIDHWANVRPTMIQGGRVVGKCYMGSTLNPKDKGGEEYETLYYGSDVTKRNENGRTSTGLYSFFLPAHKNMEDYTDKYGYCHEVVAKGDHFYNAQGIKMTIGSLQYLENEFASARKMGGKTYNNVRRLDPITIEDAFRDELQSQLFDVEKINAQLSYNRNLRIEETLVRGNFYEKDGIKDAEIIWKPEEKGRFLISWIPPKELQNRTVYKPIFGANLKCPVNDDLGAFGCDPYDASGIIDSKLISTENGVEHNLGSKGALHGVTGMSLGDIPQNFFFLEYIARPKEADMFFDDVLFACRFYSMPILVENNKKMLLKHFKVRGYRGFCLNRFDKDISRLSPDEKELGGIPNNSADIINQHWTAIESYVNNFVGEYFADGDDNPIREEGVMGTMPFQRTLADWLKFNIQNRTKFDASISSGLALLAVNRHKYKPKQERKKVVMKFERYKN